VSRPALAAPAEPQLSAATLLGIAAAALLVGGLVAVAPLAGVLVAALAVAGLLLFLPDYALWFLVLLTPLTSGVRRIGPLRPNELLLLGCAAVIAVALVRRGRLSIDRRLDPAILFFLCFASVVPLAAYIARGGPISTAIAPYIAPWQYYIMFRLTAGLVRSDRWARRLLQALLLAGAVLAVVSVLQALRVGPVPRLLATYTPSAHLDLIERIGYRRTTSLLGNWHGAGVYYAFCLTTLAAGWALGRRLFPPLVALGLAGLLALALLSTNSFTAAAVAAGGVAVVAFCSGRLRSRRLWAGLAALGAVAAVAGFVLRDYIGEQIAFQFSDFAYGYGYVERAIPFLPRTVANRMLSWYDQFGPVIRANWLFGYGPELPDVGAQSDDSQYIYALLKGGVLYLVAFLLLMVALLRCTWRRFRQAAPGSWDELVHLLGFTLLLVMQPAFFLQAYLTYSGVAEFLWVVIALGSGLALARPAPAGAPAPAET